MRGFASRLISLSIATLFLLSLPLGAQAPVEVEMSATGIGFQTKASFERLVLTISGPEDTFLQREFESGASLQFGLFDEGDLPDGSYTYELHLVPSISNELREQLTQLRERGDAVGTASKGAVTSGHFTILEGQIVTDREERIATKDQVILDDLIVDGSICAGQDCVNGESFGFDTLRLKENNLRIKFQDTSNSASFPTNDWQLTANESSNGGLNKFSIDDIDGGRTPFTLEAGAPSHSLYVDDGGRIGLGTSTPVVEVHVKDGDSPTVRLEQDGTSGFTPQTWDVAGNETNFFVRDATTGSRLPFRIRPAAPSNSIFIDTDGDVGMGTSSPQAGLHINTATTQTLRLENPSSFPRMTMVNGNLAQTWHQQVENTNGSMVWIDTTDSGVTEMTLDTAGNLTVSGNFTATTGGSNIPDYVFEPDYELMPLEDVEEFVKANKHLPRIPNAEEIERTGLNMTQMQIKLLEKVEELTLYTIEQHKTIAQLQARLAALESDRETVEN